MKGRGVSSKWPASEAPCGRLSRAELLVALDRELRTIGAQSVMLGHAVADRVDINSTDLEALDLLQLHGPITAGRLAELTGLTTGAITGLVDRLERAGYARRERDPRDRRRVIIRTIPERLREIAPLYESMARATAELLARYGDEELALILDFAARANALTLAEIAKLRAKATPADSPERAEAAGRSGNG
jgi:DNA-binding MarR family transcriptional regulator